MAQITTPIEANNPEGTRKTMADRDEETGQFLQGKTGNPKGRPKGSRNKLGEAFLSDLYADWQENGEEVIQTVRSKRPDVYMKVVASILPRDLNVNVNPLEEATDDELVQRLRDLESVIRPFLGAEGSHGNSQGNGAQKAH